MSEDGLLEIESNQGNTMSKTASQIREEIENHQAKVKALKKQERALQRRDLARQQRQLEKNNQLLGAAVAHLLSAGGLKTIRGHVCARKSDFVHQVKGQPDETAYNNLLAYIDEVIASKETKLDAPTS